VQLPIICYDYQLLKTISVISDMTYYMLYTLIINFNVIKIQKYKVKNR